MFPVFSVCFAFMILRAVTPSTPFVGVLLCDARKELNTVSSLRFKVICGKLENKFVLGGFYVC